MLLIQFFLVFFALFALGRAWKQFHAARLTKREVVFWSVFWMAVGVAAVLPQTTDVAARFVGVGRGVDLVIYLSLLTLFYIVFRIFIKLENLEREITLLVRQTALEDFEKKEPRALSSP